MTQFYSRIDTEFNGDVYNIPFSYSKESEISVYLDDELFTGWYFLNESQIKFTELPSKTPEIVTIKRTTDITKKVVEYTNNTMLSKEALNLSQDQLLNAVQEVYDNNVQFQTDTDEILETNKQEVLDIQDDFKHEVYKMVDEVKDAADKINELEEAVNTAVTAANTATEQAGIAINKANETTELVEQTNTTIQGTIQDFTENIDSKISTNNENMQSVLSETEAVLQETKDTLADTLHKTQISNCLLEIPQRIKLELNNGVLTLKAGSIAIAPFGTTDLTSNYPIGSVFQHENFKVVDTQFTDGKFFVWAEVQSDMECVASTGNMTAKCFIDFVDNTFRGNASYDVSSNVAPTSNAWWYDTVNNTLGFWVNETQTLIRPNSSFPLSIATSVSQKFSSIDQTFNGMGYIDSTIWVDKGVKGLIPNGRNEDGTLRNKELITKSILMVAPNGADTFLAPLVINGETHMNIPAYKIRGIFNQDTQPTTAGSWYDTANNYWYYSTDGTNWVKQDTYLFLSTNIQFTNGKVDKFVPKKPFSAIDYSDKTEISGWGMPSTKSINLTLGADGSTYTAPTNGWVYIRKTVSASNQYLSVTAGSLAMRTTSSASNNPLTIFVPVRKGGTFMVNYSAAGATNTFRFIYAEGEI